MSQISYGRTKKSTYMTNRKFRIQKVTYLAVIGKKKETENINCTRFFPTDLIRIQSYKYYSFKLKISQYIDRS